MGYIKEHGIEAVCFDIDGTLYPKWQTNLRSITHTVLPFIPFDEKQAQA